MTRQSKDTVLFVVVVLLMIVILLTTDDNGGGDDPPPNDTEPTDDAPGVTKPKIVPLADIPEPQRVAATTAGAYDVVWFAS